MSFSDDQKKQLAAKLNPDAVKPPAPGKYGSYIEGWHSIAEANRIFGFDGWSYRVDSLAEGHRELVELTGKNGNAYEQWRVMFSALVTVEAGGITHQDVGCGHGQGKPQSLGDAIESAMKEAVTDALKRALKSFGNPFGLALYDKSGANVGVDEEARAAAHAKQWTDATIARVKTGDLAYLSGLERSGHYSKLKAEHQGEWKRLDLAAKARREELNGMQAPPSGDAKPNSSLPKKPQPVNGEAAHG